MVIRKDDVVGYNISGRRVSSRLTAPHVFGPIAWWKSTKLVNASNGQHLSQRLKNIHPIGTKLILHTGKARKKNALWKRCGGVYQPTTHRTSFPQSMIMLPAKEGEVSNDDKNDAGKPLPPTKHHINYQPSTINQQPSTINYQVWFNNCNDSIPRGLTTTTDVARTWRGARIFSVKCNFSW